MSDKTDEGDILESLRIEQPCEHQSSDLFPTNGVLIYEAINDKGTYSLLFAASDGASRFHILGMLESAAMYLREELLDTEEEGFDDD